MAYIGYDPGLRPSSGRTRPRPAGARLAWDRLALLAASPRAWFGSIAALRAIF